MAPRHSGPAGRGAARDRRLLRRLVGRGVGRRRPGAEGGHGGGDRLAQSVRRHRRPGVQHLRHGVPAARPVRAGGQDRGRLRRELDALQGRARLDVPPPPRRQVVGRQAADGRGRRMDGQHGTQVRKRADRAARLVAGRRQGLQGDRRQHGGRHVQAAGRAGAGEPRAVLHPARAHLVAVHRQQRQGSEGVLPREAACRWSPAGHTR